MYVYIYVYAHARTHAPRARRRRRRRRRRRGIRTGNPTHATHAPRRGSTPNGNPPRGRTRRQIARHASSDDSAHTERRSIALKNRTHVRWSSSVTSGAPRRRSDMWHRDFFFHRGTKDTKRRMRTRDARTAHVDARTRRTEDVHHREWTTSEREIDARR